MKNLWPINLSTPDPLAPVLINSDVGNGPETHNAIYIDPHEIAVIEPTGENSCKLVLRLQAKAVVIPCHSAHTMAYWFRESMRPAKGTVEM